MEPNSQKFLLVLCTVADSTDAKNIAKTLVKEKLAACVNILPKVESHYVWQDELCEEQEIQLFIKTREELFESLKNRIIQIHPYDCPEIIGLPVEKVHLAYAQWLIQMTSSG